MQLKNHCNRLVHRALEGAKVCRTIGSHLAQQAKLKRYSLPLKVDRPIGNQEPPRGYCQAKNNVVKANLLSIQVGGAVRTVQTQLTYAA